MALPIVMVITPEVPAPPVPMYVLTYPAPEQISVSTTVQVYGVENVSVGVLGAVLVVLTYTKTMGCLLTTPDIVQLAVVALTNSNTTGVPKVTAITRSTRWCQTVPSP